MVGHVSFVQAEMLRERPAPPGRPASLREELAPSGSTSQSEWSDAADAPEVSSANAQEGLEALAGPATRWRRIRHWLETKLNE